MPKKPTSHRRPWAAKDLKVLKQFAKQKKTQRAVALALGRTPAAVQQKAFAEGIASSYYIQDKFSNIATSPIPAWGGINELLKNFWLTLR